MSADERLHAQDFDWEFPQLQGQVVSKIHAFTDDPDDSHPEKVLLELMNGQTHSFFMSAGCGCWRQLDEEDLVVDHDAYEDVRRVDYTERFGLRGQVIERVRCEGVPTMIQIRLSGGLLSLTEGNWNGPTTPDVICFVPNHGEDPPPGDINAPAAPQTYH